MYSEIRSFWTRVRVKRQAPLTINYHLLPLLSTLTGLSTSLSVSTMPGILTGRDLDATSDAIDEGEQRDLGGALSLNHPSQRPQRKIVGRRIRV